MIGAADIAFDDAGQPVERVDFALPETAAERLLGNLEIAGVNPPDAVAALEIIKTALETDGGIELKQAERAQIRQEAILELISFCAEGRVGALAVGRRVLMLQHLLNPARTSQRSLAARLRLGAPQISQGLNRMRRFLRARFGNGQQQEITNELSRDSSHR